MLDELKKENEQGHCAFKFKKDRWWKYTDQIIKSGKSPTQEPEWFNIIQPIFSDTHGNLNLTSKEVRFWTARMQRESDLAPTSDSRTACETKRPGNKAVR